MIFTKKGDAIHENCDGLKSDWIVLDNALRSVPTPNSAVKLINICIIRPISTSTTFRDQHSPFASILFGIQDMLDLFMIELIVLL